MDNSPIRILLIDDDEDDYVVTRRMVGQMEDGRFALEWSATANAALERLERNHYDLYLLDYQLGEHTGLDVLREARARGCTAPFIMVTGPGDRAVDLAAMQAGATDYLVKRQLTAAL